MVFENENIIELLYSSDDAGYDFPWYVETYYYDSSEKWMIYVSHEGTITFAGEEIVAIRVPQVSVAQCNEDISYPCLYFLFIRKNIMKLIMVIW